MRFKKIKNKINFNQTNQEREGEKDQKKSRNERRYITMDVTEI